MVRTECCVQKWFEADLSGLRTAFLARTKSDHTLSYTDHEKLCSLFQWPRNTRWNVLVAKINEVVSSSGKKHGILCFCGQNDRWTRHFFSRKTPLQFSSVLHSSDGLSGEITQYLLCSWTKYLLSLRPSPEKWFPSNSRSWNIETIFSHGNEVPLIFFDGNEAHRKSWFPSFISGCSQLFGLSSGILYGPTLS